MKVTIFGTGYVGLVTGVCLAELGNDVICVDIDAAKIKSLQDGIVPIYEPQLPDLLISNLNHKRLNFTTDFEQGIHHGIAQFIAVGTPCDDGGRADVGAVYAVASKIGELMKNYCLVINKSTVPVGTADEVRLLIKEQLEIREVEIDFDIASNPEFLREGAAINDFMLPDRIIVGADNTRAQVYLRELYQPLIDSGKRFVVMDTRSSELTKYASNAFLATKISFINELSHLAEKLEADIEQVRIGMTMDPRIGEHFLYPGCGYGGSCFPKDIQALQCTASDHGQELRILSATAAVNEQQKHILIRKLRTFMQDDLAGKTVALWGLAFKPNTNDMREASSRVIIENLLALGVTIQAYDPAAGEEARKLYGHHSNFKLGLSADAVLDDADVLLIVTEWNEFRFPNFQMIEKKLRYKAIFDGRNLYEPSRVQSFGLEYFAVGRGSTVVPRLDRGIQTPMLDPAIKSRDDEL